ncbi:AcrR family transcriptional regulator [Bradyrhizobium diazoefficiens]
MGMGRPREFDAETALDQAMEVFWRHGYEGATIAQLTEAMGINPPSLYACFGNKEGLLKAALDRYTKLRNVWMDGVVSAPTAREVAERMLMGIADKQTDPANPPGCLLVQGGIACGSGSPRMSPSNSPPAALRTKISSATVLFAPRRKVISSRALIPPRSRATSLRSPSAWA